MPKASKYRGLMKAAQFNAASRHSLMQARTLAAARAVLVDGLPPEVAARNAELSRQQLNGALATLAADAIPAGWTAAQICLPNELMEKVRAMEERERAKLKKKEQNQ